MKKYVPQSKLRQYREDHLPKFCEITGEPLTMDNSKIMESKKITVNGIDMTVYSDGSIEKPYYGKRLKRTFGWSNNGYRHIKAGGRIGGKTLKVHRLVAMAFLDDFSDDLQVDHINGNGSDNRPENLRMVTGLGNNRAFVRKRKGASSKYRGVSWCRSRERWTAKIRVYGTLKHLGYFTDEVEAALAYNRATVKYGFAPEAANKIH